MNSPTLTGRATQMGVFLGTAAYMAPEQARGKPVDTRADIWAFGAVLFEMLTSRRAFAREEITDTIVSVISKEPDRPALPSSTPVSVRPLLRRCLDKDPKRRLRDIGEARLALSGAFETTAPQTTAMAPLPTPRGRLVWMAALAVAGVVIIAFAIPTVRHLREPAPPERAPIRLSFSRPCGTTLTNAGRPVLTMSPDGTKVVLTSDYQLYVRKLDAAEAEPAAGTESTGLTSPLFLPGRSVGHVLLGRFPQEDTRRWRCRRRGGLSARARDTGRCPARSA
jgi:hypothetical protein